MKTTVKCYKYSLSDEPFLVLEVKDAKEMVKELSDKISWRDYANDIWVKIGIDALLYDPMLDIFKDWNGVRFVNINNQRLNYYFC